MDHSDSERGNPLPPHGLLFLINSKGSFICTIPQTGLHIPQPLLHQLWSTGWNAKNKNNKKLKPFYKCFHGISFKMDISNIIFAHLKKKNNNNNNPLPVNQPNAVNIQLFYKLNLLTFKKEQYPPQKKKKTQKKPHPNPVQLINKYFIN